MSRVGYYIFNNSLFLVVNYGYKKLGDLIWVIELFDIDMRNDGVVMYIWDLCSLQFFWLRMCLDLMKLVYILDYNFCIQFGCNGILLGW